MLMDGCEEKRIGNGVFLPKPEANYKGLAVALLGIMRGDLRSRIRMSERNCELLSKRV